MPRKPSKEKLYIDSEFPVMVSPEIEEPSTEEYLGREVVVEPLINPDSKMQCPNCMLVGSEKLCYFIKEEQKNMYICKNCANMFSN